MQGDPLRRLDLARLLAAVEDAPSFSAADVLGERLASEMDAREVAFLIADFSGHALIRLGHSGGNTANRTQGDETAERVPLIGSAPGRALATQSLVLEPGPGGTRVFAPVTNRGEAIGVLELLLDDAPGEHLLADVALAAHALGCIVIANRRFTDLFEWGQRSVPLTLAAEIQHRLLPGAYTCEAGQFTLAGWLEPAGNVGGDMVAAGAHMHPREAVQHLTQAIDEATGGELIDDATAMCLDWHGGPARNRTSSSGSNR
jgi:hypothetical protein